MYIGTTRSTDRHRQPGVGEAFAAPGMGQVSVMDDALLDTTTYDHDGTRTITRGEAIALVRERGIADDTDDEVWTVWQRHDNGPTNRVDLDRVVAELAGIAADG
jgi:hypothetical protein